MRTKRTILSVALVAVGILVGTFVGFQFGAKWALRTSESLHVFQPVHLSELVYDAYRSSDKEHAERALLLFKKHLQHNIELNLPSTIVDKHTLLADLALTYARIGSLRESRGDVKQAQSDYESAIEVWAAAHAAEDEASLTVDEMKAFIAKLDNAIQGSQQAESTVPSKAAPSASSDVR